MFDEIRFARDEVRLLSDEIKKSKKWDQKTVR
jgi:hypothetical protein